MEVSFINVHWTFINDHQMNVHVAVDERSHER